MALPNFNINPYVQPYVGGIQRELGQAITQRIADYDLASEFYDILGYQTDTLMQNVAPFAGDVDYAKQLMSKNRQLIEEAASRGDYENMVRDVKRQARNFTAELTPLIQRKQAFQEFTKNLDERYRKNELSLSQVEAAKRLAYIQNSSADIDTIRSGGFSAFNPSNKVDLSKMLDDAIKGMESQGKIGKLSVDHATGTYRITGGQYRTIDEIKKAAEQYLLGSSEYKNYAQTMSTLGLQNELIQEINSAISAVGTKYQFDRPDDKLGFVPKDWLDNYIFNNSNLQVAAGPVTDNLLARNQFEGQKILTDGSITGTDNYFTQNQDGTFSKVVDKTGRIVSKQEVLNLTTPIGVVTGGRAPTLSELGFKVVPATPEEQQVMKNKINKQFDKLVEDVLLKDTGFAGFNPQDRQKILNTPSARAKLNDPKYREQVLERYNKALEHHKTTETFFWTKDNYVGVKVVGDFMALDKGAGKLQTGLSGSSVGVLTKLDSDLQKELGLKTGYQNGKKDINTILKAVGDNGWKVKSVRDKGVANINPFEETLPASILEMEVEHPDKGTRVIDLTATIGFRDQTPRLNFVQQVGAAHLSGNPRDIQVPGSNRKARVTPIPAMIDPNIPNELVDTDDNVKVSFTTYVEEIDEKGNPIPHTRQLLEDFIYQMEGELKQELRPFIKGNKE